MSEPTVTIDQGTLRGFTGKNLRGETIFKFKGIPYAKPPLGELRFKAPQPPEKWNGILDATREGNECYARDMIMKPGEISGSENCLFLNVYTKNLPSQKNKTLKPVMFWIHGGGYILGSGNEELYGPDFLLLEDVVLVTINYRLGIFGFLNFEDPSIEVPGNAGCKDMVMALKWVQKNIASFNGDPSNVTIFGESAGGASVTLLLMSPLSKGLFHKAIAQSGCAINPWLPGTKGVARLASSLGIKHDEKAIYKMLMEKSTEEVYELHEKTVDLLVPNHLRPYGLVVEASGPQAFLDQEPIDIIKTKAFHDVPIICGFTSAEGMCFEMFKSPLQINEPTIEEYIPWILGYKAGTPDSRKLAEKIKHFYYGDEKPSAQTISKKYDLLSDVMFVYGICVAVLNQYKSIKSPLYLYQMTIETELNFLKKLGKITVPGTSHADDLGYLFNHFATPKIEAGSIEEKSIERFVKLWTNFAKFGNPTPDKDKLLFDVIWRPVNSDKLEYLDIGRDLLTSNEPFLERLQFWKEIYANSPEGQKYL